MSVAEIVYKNIDQIIQFCNTNQNAFTQLLDLYESKELFDLNYSFFIETKNIDDSVSKTSSARYKAKVFQVCNKSVRVTNDWYIRNIPYLKKYFTDNNLILNVPIAVVNSGPKQRKVNGKTKWPLWELPNDDEIYQLAQVVTKYIKFLNPDIIGAITEDNEKSHNTWREKLTAKNINAELYLWENSPCCFPGVRRYAGSKEIAYYRKHTGMDRKEIPNALRLDDNDFPKQIWSFVFQGRQFSKQGPSSYSLAHLIDHKESKNRMETEFEFDIGHTYSEPYFGLYTSPSNAVYIPTILIRPTDFNLILRKLLFQKAEQLYKGYCNIIPPYIKIRKSNDRKWDIGNFEWCNCVGEMTNIGIFLDYRKKKMEEFLNDGIE